MSILQRTRRVAALAGILGLCLFSASAIQAGAIEASKAPKTPPNINGSWFGDFKAGKEHGTVLVDITQNGNDCTFTAFAQNDDGSTATVNGSFTMNGKKIVDGAATIDDGSIVQGASVSGKAAKDGSSVKLILENADGKAKATVFPD